MTCDLDPYLQGHLFVPLLSHPGLGWFYVFSSFPPRPPPRPLPQQLLPLTSKLFQINLTYLAQRIYGSGEMYWLTFQWPWPKVTSVASISKNLLVCAIKWEPFIRSLQNVTALLPWSWASPDWILEKFCWKLLFWQNFFKNFGCVFSRSNTILAISQQWLVLLMWNKKEVHRLHVGYNIWPCTLTSLMTLTLDVSRSNFAIAVSQELLVWLIWNEKVVS